MQVSQVWSVGATTSHNKSWDTAVLKKLGGHDVIGKVWEQLKSRKQTGHGKRQAEGQPDIPSKKPRIMEVSSSNKGTLVTVWSPAQPVFSAIETLEQNSNSTSTPAITNTLNVEVSKPKLRVRRKARRHSLIATPKITEWLLKVPDNATSLQATPKDTGGTKKNKRKRRKAAKNKRSTPKPRVSFSPIPSLTHLVLPSNPILQFLQKTPWLFQKIPLVAAQCLQS